MKKHLLILVAGLFSLAAGAQITLTRYDLSPFYNQYRHGNDTLPNNVSAGNAGASQTWSYDSLTNYYTDTVTVTYPQWTGYAANFPGSNYAFVNQAMSTTNYAFLDTTSSLVNAIGEEANLLGNGMIALTYDNPEKILVFPATYNTAYSDTAFTTRTIYYGQTIMSIPVDSVRIHQHVWKTGVFDAWGSLTIPMGTYNVLRQNEKRVENDTIDAYYFGSWHNAQINQMDSNRVYTFWANNIGLALVQLTDGQDLGTITNAQWLLGTAVVAGIPVNTAQNDFKVYPNPSSDYVTFASAGKNLSRIEILDMNGKLVKSQGITSSETQVDVSFLPAGMYFYRVSDGAGNCTARGKFNVLH